MTDYSREFKEHLQHPKNSGSVSIPDGDATVVNPACGDELRLTLRVQDNHITWAKFQAQGCGAALAAGSVVTELLAGCKLELVASTITPQAVEQALGGLPRFRRHAAVLASQAATRAAQAAIDKPASN